MRFLTAAFVLATIALARNAAAGDDDDDASVSKKRCALGTGNKAGKIVTTTEKEACGSGGCTQRETTELLDGARKTLIVFSGDVGGDFGPDSSVVFACKGGLVVIGDDKGDLLNLSYEAAEHRLRLPESVRKQVEDGWRARPARGAAAALRERLAEALTALTPGGSASEPPAFEVLGLEPELAQSLSLLVARDKVEAGAWESAEKLVNAAVPDKAPPAEVVASRKASVLARLAALRRQSAPVAVADRHRIGAVLAAPATPVDVGKAPTLFWRGDLLCVGQEDHTPPTEMRCLEPKTRKWGAREPMQKPSGSGDRLRSMSYPNVTRCDGTYVVQATIPDTGEDACNGGPGEDAEDLVGVVDGDAMLLANEHGLRVNRSPTRTNTLTAAQANALIATSPGSQVVGNGCCRFLDDGRVARMAAVGDERRWPILGPPPEDEQWVQTPLASPSQAWAVAFSQGSKATTVTLWLLRLTTRH